jgi:hypothetical protein
MSGTLAIAAVSAVMKSLLHGSLTEYGVLGSVGGEVQIGTLPPDKVPEDVPRLNIYFYRPTVNPGWASAELPSRNSDGERISNPYLALDLHYLVTAHATKDFHGEILLGYAMQIFHEHPVLARQTIRDTLGTASPDIPEPTRVAINAASLAEQIEQIKITPHQLSLEETSNVWSTLQTEYRPMAAYKVSVVLIESKRPARASLPVREYNIRALPFQQPVITDVISEDGPGTPISTDKKLIVRGEALKGTDTRVSVAGVELQKAELDVQSTAITFKLPAAARAGINGVHVKQYLSFQTPVEPHRGFESNVAAFVLQPRIKKADGEYDMTVLGPSGSEPRTLKIGLTPRVDPPQRAQVLLNELNAPTDRLARAYTMEASARSPDSPATEELRFPIPGVPNGNYLIRVRVDGAESPLDFQAPDGYVAPKVNLA